MDADAHMIALMRLIAEKADKRGFAVVSEVADAFGEDFSGTWNKLYDGRYIERGGERHLLSLTPLGRAKIGRRN